MSFVSGGWYLDLPQKNEKKKKVTVVVAVADAEAR